MSTASCSQMISPVQAALKLQHAIVLPNGWHVHHSNHREATFIYKEIFKQRCYIQHGIMVRDGDICVDVGANVGGPLGCMCLSKV